MNSSLDFEARGTLSLQKPEDERQHTKRLLKAQQQKLEDLFNQKHQRLMGDYDKVIQAKNQELQALRQCLDLRDRDCARLKKDLERVSSVLADSDRQAAEWEHRAGALQLRVERFEREALDRENNKAQRRKEEDENFKLRL